MVAFAGFLFFVSGCVGLGLLPAAEKGLNPRPPLPTKNPLEGGLLERFGWVCRLCPVRCARPSGYGELSERRATIAREDGVFAPAID